MVTIMAAGGRELSLALSLFQQECCPVSSGDGRETPRKLRSSFSACSLWVVSIQQSEAFSDMLVREQAQSCLMRDSVER
eukprot:764816-Hanusia_phi.AAC.2